MAAPMMAQQLSQRQACRCLPALQPVAASSRAILIPRKRQSVKPCASYRQYDDWTGRSRADRAQNFWNRAASGFVNASLAELLEQFEKDFAAANGGKASSSAAASAKAAPTDDLLPIDSLESADDITYYVDVPGLEKKDLKIQVNQQDRSLTVSGERFQPATLEGTDGVKSINKFERRFGKFSRRVVLPESADTQLISAKVDKGVLRIKVLKQIKQSPDIQEVEID